MWNVRLPGNELNPHGPSNTFRARQLVDGLRVMVVRGGVPKTLGRKTVVRKS